MSESTVKNAPAGDTDIDLDAIIEQRAEARGDEGDTFSFRFGGQKWTALDPQLLDDEQKDELAEITHDIDTAAWYMGDDQYDKFVEAGGNSSVFFQALIAYNKKTRDEVNGRPTRRNRSSRRAQKRTKQR